MHIPQQPQKLVACVFDQLIFYAKRPSSGGEQLAVGSDSFDKRPPFERDPVGELTAGPRGKSRGADPGSLMLPIHLTLDLTAQMTGIRGRRETGARTAPGRGGELGRRPAEVGELGWRPAETGGNHLFESSLQAVLRCTVYCVQYALSVVRCAA